MNWKVPVLRSALLYLMGQVYQAHLKQFPGLHSFQDGGYIVTRRYSDHPFIVEVSMQFFFYKKW